MASIGKVSAVFTASTSGLTSGVKAASSSFRSLQSDTKGLESAMRTLVAINATQLFASVASAAISSVRSLVSFGKAQADVVDNASKLAARLGMTYGEFAGLSLAADLAGVSMDTIGKASQKAEIAFANAANGSKVATAAFAGLGLSVEQLNGISASERFDAIAASIAALPTEAQRAAAAVRIFGRAGAELLPLFAGGAEGIAAAREQAERLGLTLTNAQGQNVEAMNDAFTMVAKSISGVVQQIVAYLAPAITSIANTFVAFVGDVGGANIGQAIGDGILAGARVIAQVGDFLVASLSDVWSYVSQVSVQWMDVADGLSRVASFFSGVANIWQVQFDVMIVAASKVSEIILGAAKSMAQFLKFDTEGLDRMIRANASLGRVASENLSTNIQQMNKSFSDAFSAQTQKFGENIVGPWTAALDAAWKLAMDAANGIDVASKKPVELKQTVVVDVAQAIKGIDSRTTEGITEMFRIMRGGAGDVQEQQLSALEQIAANTAEDGFVVAEGF